MDNDAELEILECETCIGTGDLVYGWDTYHASPLTPPEPIYTECPVCMGHGSVKAWELEEWGGEFPSEDDALEYKERKEEHW